MNTYELNGKYFEWMIKLIYDEDHMKDNSYLKLFNYLNNTEFNYILPLDGNRVSDGINLRYRFGYDKNHPEPMIASFLDNRPCSILEMMVALSVRCEESIMGDPEFGNRTGKWFWSMLENLELDCMDDYRFNESYTTNIIEKFLNRKYKRNGEGGLFVVNKRSEDLRDVEIWYQMCWYLDEILGYR